MEQLINQAVVAANIRELIVQTSRGNEAQALRLAGLVQADLRSILAGPDDASSGTAQQTLFAVDEVLALVGQGDFKSALDAARDAGKEWRARPQAG
jgi:hypothetical protein